MTDNTVQKATRAALRDALEECQRMTMHNYPAWIRAIERLAMLRATITHPSTVTRAVDAYLGKAKS